MIPIPKSTKNTFHAVDAKYQKLRNLVYSVTTQAFPHLPITLRAITFHDALLADQWSTQWSSRVKRPIWSWVDMYNTCQSKNLLKRFEIALNTNGKLVALCYGIPSKHKVLLKIHALARAPIDNPLAGDVLNILFFAAIAYAELIGSQEIWLVEPMNETLVEKYQRHGYEPVRNKLGVVTHLVLKVNHE